MTKHTQTPFSVDDRRRATLKNIRILGTDGHEVCQISDVHQRDHLGPSFTHEQANAVDELGLHNAEFIVRACNLHDELVTALVAAHLFISNGIELGYILMPNPDSQNTALDIPPLIQAALNKAGVETL